MTSSESDQTSGRVPDATSDQTAHGTPEGESTDATEAFPHQVPDQPIVVVSNTRYGSTTDYAAEFARRVGALLIGGDEGPGSYSPDELDEVLAQRPEAPVIVFTPNYAGTFGGANVMKSVARATPERKMALAVIGMTILEEVREKDPALSLIHI